MTAIMATAITAKSGNTVTATVNGVDTQVQVARDLAVLLGDVLLVERVGAQWFAYARLFSAVDPTTYAPPSNETAPPPKPATTTGSLVTSPVETRSYRNSAWRTDNDTVYQGQFGGGGNHKGCVFYGTKPRSLAGATVTGATIRVKRPTNTGSTYGVAGSTLWLMTQATKPAGAPTLTSTTAGPTIAAGVETTFTIPTSWAQSMVDGTAGGLAFYDADGSPYLKFAGRGDWSPAFTLTIAWKRG